MGKAHSSRNKAHGGAPTDVATERVRHPRATPGSPEQAEAVDLQDSHGNAAVQALIQRKAEPGAEQASGPDAVAIGQAGVEGPGTSLPHLDTIQASFGAFDVSGVDAHVGGAAGEAAKALGAEAYATGDSVAFQSTPDLHTAAHEAAHVVQQDADVQLLGGTGEEGDEQEVQADEVADRVVAGDSS